MARRPADLTAFAKAYIGRNPHIGQTIAAFSIKIVGALLSFGFTILLVRAYGPAGVGQFGLAVTILLIASTAALFGTDYILIRTVAGKDDYFCFAFQLSGGEVHGDIVCR